MNREDLFKDKHFYNFDKEDLINICEKAIDFSLNEDRPVYERLGYLMGTIALIKVELEGEKND